jgi:hypothetical protein
MHHADHAPAKIGFARTVERILWCKFKILQFHIQELFREP